jgi:3,4-dihydroxy 2-butanone 4-phosphate synthase/GTP cyclohydrolase II
MSRVPELMDFAKEHKMKIVTIQALIEYRMRRELLVRRAVSVKLPTELGVFTVVAYENDLDNLNHVALIKGDITEDDDVLVRVHSECLTGDVLHSLRCDCGEQLHKAMEMIEQEGKGIILYMRQEGRGIGLVNKLKAYQLQDGGMDTVEANEELGFQADLRDYGIGAQMLVDLGVKRMRLLTNNPRKIVGLEGYGLKVTGRMPLEIVAQESNIRYLQAKKDKLGHLLDNL